MTSIPHKPCMIIGQAQRPETRGAPFQKSNLWKWFDRIGWAQDEVLRIFYFDALVDHCTPKGKKGHVPPGLKAIRDYRPRLLATIDAMRPQLVVPVGGLAAREALGVPELRDAVGQRFVAKPFGSGQAETIIIPLPHPSGVSLWLNNAQHQALLHDALALLRDEIARFK